MGPLEGEDYAAGREACKMSRAGLVLTSASVLAWKRGTEQVDWMCGLGFRGEV